MKVRNIETAPMGIANSGFLLERLGNDCHPLQLLREYTQNSIEEILKTKKTGVILWDYDPDLYKKGLRKLSITDTGGGMDAREMVRYLNHLSSSSNVQSMSENYGLGAKISAASRNPHGIIYRSLKSKFAYELILWRDPKTGNYGVKIFKDGGLFGPAKFPKKSAIKEHGTMVTFLGYNEKDNTVDHVGGVGGTSKFKIKYLNDRYWTVPKGIQILVRELDLKDPHTQLREVKGQQHFLEQYKLESGKVELKDATAYWYITNDTHYRAVHDYASAQGFVGALYKNELYDLPTYNRGRVTRLQEFGISFGHKNVFIIVKPHMKHLTTDTGRTVLLVKDLQLPWQDWAEEFRKKLPVELVSWVEANYSESKTSEAEIQRLSEIEELFSRTIRFVASPTGTIDQPLRITAPRKEKVNFETTGEEKKPSTPKDKAKKKPKSKYTEVTNSNKGKLKLAWPEVRWIESPDDEVLKNRAAKYIPALHEIHANKEFQLFKDMEWAVLHGAKQAGVTLIKEAVSDKVFEWYGQILKETVMSIKQLKWGDSDMSQALSEEALTAAVASKYPILQCIQRDLGKNLTSKVKKVVKQHQVEVAASVTQLEN